MKETNHLPDDLLIRALDDELSTAEAATVESHLERCQNCKERYGAVRLLSARIESVIAGAPLQYSEAGRARLVQRLEAAAARPASIRRGGHPVRTALWLATAAAAALIAVLLVPAGHRTRQHETTPSSSVHAALEVDGEAFLPLPYSNPDLPLSAPHIVQMQMPVSSLASAGVAFEPASNAANGADRTVLADVLMGADGQPLGVHVLSVD